MKVRARTNTRVDLCGGTLDIWPLNQIIQGATVNISVDLNAKIDLTIRNNSTFSLNFDKSTWSYLSFEDLTSGTDVPLISEFASGFWRENLPGFDLVWENASPRGAGLGGSSALATALGAGLLAARAKLDGISNPPWDSLRSLITQVQNCETRLLQSPTGCQDYWGAASGGINLITYALGGEQVETKPVDLLADSGWDLILSDTGESRVSTANNWQIFKRFFDGDEHVAGILREIGGLSLQGLKAAKNESWGELFRISKQEAALRRLLFPEMETPKLKTLNEAAASEGAYFSRFCGAGGGGVMLTVSSVDNSEKIKSALTQAGAKVLEASPSNQGLKVELS